MDFIDNLLEEHDRLRRTLRALEATAEELRAAKPPDRGELHRKLLETEGLLYQALREHEAREEELLMGPLATSGLRGKEQAIAIQTEHRSIHDVFTMLDGMVSLEGAQDLYSVHYLLAQIRQVLLRHLEFEEAKVFPRIRRVEEARRSP